MPAVATPSSGLDRCGSGVERAANEPAHTEIPLAAVLMTCSPFASLPTFSWFILFIPLPSPLTFCVGNQNHSQNYSEGVRNDLLNIPSPATVSFSNQNSLPSSFAEDPLQYHAQVLTMRWRCAHPGGVDPMVGSKHVYRYDFESKTNDSH